MISTSSGKFSENISSNIASIHFISLLFMSLHLQAVRTFHHVPNVSYTFFGLFQFFTSLCFILIFSANLHSSFLIIFLYDSILLLS